MHDAMEVRDRFRSRPEFPSRPSEDREAKREAYRPREIMPIRAAHHLSLRRGPILAASEDANLRPFVNRRQVMSLRLRVPQPSALGEFQSRAPRSGFPFFAVNPVAERLHEVVVGELIIAGAARSAPPKAPRRG